MLTNYDEILPDGILFNIKEINEMNLIKSSMLKKLILNREIEVVKLGKKNHISRASLIAYLEENTIPVEK